MKKILKMIDQFVLGGLLLSYKRRKMINQQLAYKKETFNFGMTFRYPDNSNSLLNLLCAKYGSDKGEVNKDNLPYLNQNHTYTDFYELLFQLNRSGIKNVLECGILNGASLRVWRDYFENAEVIGIDIDKTSLFNEERIRTFHCDQTSVESIKGFIDKAKIKAKSLDVVIDDGLHEFFAGVCLFENLIDCLAPNGFYIIEDVVGSDYLKYKDYFADKSESFIARFIILDSPRLVPTGDNRLIVVSKIKGI